MSEPRKLKRAVIREEFVALTGNHIRAVILAQLDYWQRRIDDFDVFLEQERQRSLQAGVEFEAELTAGWIYKTASELSEETMLHLSDSTMRSHIQALVKGGWVLARHNPRFKWDRTWQYKLDLLKIQEDLAALGYSLQDWKLAVPSSEIENGSSESANGGSDSVNGVAESEDQTNENRTAIPETTPEITSETTTNTTSEKKDSRKNATKTSCNPDEAQSVPYRIYAHYLTAIPAGNANLPKTSAGRQMAIAKRMLKDGYSEDQIRRCIDYMSRDPYWQHRGWTLQNVRGKIDEWIAGGELERPPGRHSSGSQQQAQRDQEYHDNMRRVLDQAYGNKQS